MPDDIETLMKKIDAGTDPADVEPVEVIDHDNSK